MESTGTDPRDKKLRSAKSCNNGSVPLKIAGNKRSSFTENEAVKSVDQALGRLKKSRFSGENRPESPLRRRDMFLDNMSTSYHSHDNASTISLNFSNYELQRNLSHLNCDSDDAFSDLTGNTATARPQDRAVKDERLERYFRSAELWNMRYRDGGSRVHFDIPEKNEQNQ